MRYSILFSFVSFCLLQLSSAQTQNLLTIQVLEMAQSFAATYSYSIVPPSYNNPSSTSMAIWWTPDITNSKIKFGIMGGESSFVGFGFNTAYPLMAGGTGVICGNGTIQVYNLIAESPNGGVSLAADQSNIQNIVIQEIDNWIFAEFTWVLVPPHYWNITQPTNFLWSTRQAVPKSAFLSTHDNQGTFSPFTFTKNATSQGFDEASFINCNNGVANSYFPFLGKSCRCASGFTPESNCSISSFPFSHEFRAKDDSLIATMYWSLEGSIANFVVKSIPGAGWTGIAFSDIAGEMGPADAVVYPIQSNVQPLFLEGEGVFNPIAYITITTTSFVTAFNVNYYGFTRNLSFVESGGTAITDFTSVPMTAATSLSPWPRAHGPALRSDGSDILNLRTGTSKPGPFVWTKFTTHGLLMWMSWGIIIPCGFLWARFVKGYPNDKSALWFEGHRTLMSIGFVLVIVSAVYAVGLAGTHLDSTHKILGATVVACALYQVMSAVMRPHADPTNPSPQRLVFEYTHHFVGRSTIIIAWVTICYGLMLVHGISMSVVWGHVALSVIWLVAALVLEIRKAIITRRNREYESLNRR